MKLLIKIPTRERGYDWLDAYLSNISNPDTRVLLSIDDDCPFPEQQDGILMVLTGKRAGKIEAINRDIDRFINDFDVIMVGSDDMEPQQFGFDQIILDDMAREFPNTDGCLWYSTEDSEPELKRRLKREVKFGSSDYMKHWICMMPVMGRAYYQRFGYIYHPSYRSMWCDNEQTEVAMRLGKIRCMASEIVKHQHPAWVAGITTDNLYKSEAANHHQDMKNYQRRKAHSFPK